MGMLTKIHDQCMDGAPVGVTEQVLQMECRSARVTQAVFCDGSDGIYGFPHCDNIATALGNSKCDKNMIDEEALLVAEHLNLLGSTVAYDHRELLVLERQKEDIEAQIAGVVMRLQRDQEVFKQAKETEKMISSGNNAAARKALLSVLKHVRVATTIANSIDESAGNEIADENKVDLKQLNDAQINALSTEILKPSPNVDDFNVKGHIQRLPSLENGHVDVPQVTESALQAVKTTL